MKRAILALGVVLALSVGAHGISMDCGPGGWVYWSISNSNSTTMHLWRAQIDSNWNLVAGSMQDFDDLTETVCSADQMESDMYEHHNVEVLDPRNQGGTGSLVLSLHTDPNTNNTAFYNDKMDIYQITNPTGTPTNTMISDMRTRGSANWDTGDLGSVMGAPANWIPGKTSNGISMVTLRNSNTVSYGNGSSYVFNSVPGIIDNTSSANGVNLVNTQADGAGVSSQWSYPACFDQEFGPDKALYRLQNNFSVTRTFAKAVMDNTAGSNYLPVTASIGRATGMAVGLGNLGKTMKDGKAASAANIVYLLSYDSNSRLSLWAIQDVNGDNVIDATNDRIVQLWENSASNGVFVLDSGNSYGNYDTQDVEVVQEASGKRVLLFNDYYQELCALELADNGLALSGAPGKVITTGFGISSYQNTMGFELDMNPLASVPEPATMFLLGTGALGALGWMRRRRVK